MSANIKICYRTEFSRIGRVLTVEVGIDEK